MTTKVKTGGITNVSVTTAKIADDAVTAAKIADNAIGADNIVADAITTVKIADTAVTLAKLEHGTSSNDGKFLRANNGADPSFETVSIPAGTTINSNGANRIITGSNSSDTLEGNSNFTYTGNIVSHSNPSGLAKLEVKGGVSGGALGASITLRNTDAANNGLTDIQFLDAGTNTYAKIQGTSLTDSSNNGFLSFFTSSATSGLTERAKLTDGGNFEISDGNLIIGTSGHGIDFSATANASQTGASMSSELLDDYEEGSWTPVLNSGTINASYAKYVRIGAMCWVMADIGSLSDTSSSTAILIRMNSFPFAKSSFCDGIHIGMCPNRYFSHSSKDSLMHWMMNGSGAHLHSSNDSNGDKAYTSVPHSHVDASYSAFKIAGWYTV